MSPEELERILASDDVVQPSPDFAAQVMMRVRSAAAEPAPPRFPWVRFLTGVAASGVSAAAGVALLPRFGPTFPPIAAAAPEITYAAVVLLATFAAVSAPRLFADYD